MANSSDDDDQALRLWKQSGSFSVAVFAPLGDLAAGATSFSILVQDQRTQEVLLDSAVQLSARPSDAMDGGASLNAASNRNSQNKLLQTAELDLPTAGEWILDVGVSRNSEIANLSLPLHVVKRESGLTDFWPYFLFPAFGMVLFASYIWKHSHQPAASPVEQHMSS